MRRLWLGISILCVVLTAVGCMAQGKAAHERSRTRGQMDLFGEDAGYRLTMSLRPDSHVSNQGGIKVTLKHLDGPSLERIFANEKLFGKNAGDNPYPPDVVVFYLTITNNSGGKISVDPRYFVMIDDMSSQYLTMDPDAINGLVEAKSSGGAYAFVKTTASAAGGIYGSGANLAGSLASQGQRKKTVLLRQVQFTGGYVHDGIIYDGLIAFLKAHVEARKVRVVLPGFKSKFNVKDEPGVSYDFDFEFDIVAEEKPEASEAEQAVGRKIENTFMTDTAKDLPGEKGIGAGQVTEAATPPIAPSIQPK
ncbi:MAG: hypothetical protein JW937_10155 [Candidatus Omnitrophica bacterium]|nr:hypothetical protein [Candidatus Omnitrophota bacterium]